MISLYAVWNLYFSLVLDDSNESMYIILKSFHIVQLKIVFGHFMEL
jgi:hypothetical protein